MTQPIALLVEASGIQEYVFGSNELAQHIGASELVTQATTDWLFDKRTGLLPTPHNVVRSEPGSPSRWQITDKTLAQGLSAEVVYAGGGNALLLLADEAQARALALGLTSKALCDAPGLRLAVAWQPFQPGQLAAAVDDLHKEVGAKKREPARSAPLLGLGVTAACVYTSGPAVAVDERGRYVSAEVQAKQKEGRANGSGNARLLEYLGDVRRDNFEFVYDFNQLGTRHDSSYLAVAHTDGNRMGDRIVKYIAQYAHDDGLYIKAYREFSASVQETAHRALVSTVGLLLDPSNLVYDGEKDAYTIGGKAPVQRSQDDKFDRLPFRPIVFGGDDVTFVCDGRLGLPLTAHYLSQMAAQRLPDGEPLHARAGVAIVPNHYPFARAYDLSARLCDSAKEFIKEVDPSKRALTALDWHFAVTGLLQPLKAMRAREYTVSEGSLLLRPLRLAPVDRQEPRSWDVFSDLIEAFVKEGGAWANRRNKVKALREALRDGPEAVKLLLRSLREDDPLPTSSGLAAYVDAATTGWQGDRCIYFDAVEALDFYIPLHGVAL